MNRSVLKEHEHLWCSIYPNIFYIVNTKILSI